MSERRPPSAADTEVTLGDVLDATTSVGVFAKDLDGRYLFVSSGFEQFMGVSRDAVLGRTTEEVFAPEIARHLLASDARAIVEARAIALEDEFAGSGGARTVLTRKFPLFGTDGKVRAVCGVATDITERKRTEAAMRRAALAVSTASGPEVFETLVRQLAEILGAGVAMISVFFDAQRTRMRSVAAYMDGAPLPPFEYEVAWSPCAGMVGREFRFVPEGVRIEMGPGMVFAAEGFDSYAAYSLNAASGEQMGLLAVLDRRPLTDRGLVESMLKIFAVRAAAELERARAEQALRASESSYRSIFEAAEDAIFVHDWESGRILDVSPKAVELYGYPRERLLDLRVGDVSSGEHPYTEAEAVRRIGEAKSSEVPVRFAWRARHREGHLMWHEVTLKRATIAGEPRILAFVRDVTDRKDAEEALRASEEQYRSIFNATADALVLRDADFRIVDVNTTYEVMSGLGRDEVIGADRIFANPPEIRPQIRALHARAIAGEMIAFETQLVRRDGERRELELRGVPVPHRGRPHVLYLGRDITVQKHAEAERGELEAQLRQAQKMEAIGHLTGGIAHDFNNILTSIMGYISLAADREAAQGDSKLASHLERALASAERARDLIQQMLTFSRGRRGDPRPVALAPLVRESAKLLRSTLPSSVDLAIDLAREVPRVMLDPVHADQVLLNLCINARDAMDARGAVRVSLRRGERSNAVCASCRKRVAGSFVELAVADNGPGIAPEVLERMFEPFFTTKDIGKGSGMGLATVHGIVHEHGGHVLVETAPGRGTTFRVLLPALAPADGGLAEGAGAGGRSGAARAALAGRVLVVDDEEAVGEFMRERLESWGLAVTLVADPIEGRDAFARSPDAFDLAITDQTMPRMTGVQLAGELRAVRPDVPVVLYTGFADARAEQDARAAGIVAVLRKPVEPEALLAVLRAHLPGLVTDG